MPIAESQLHGLLVVDKPGLPLDASTTPERHTAIDRTAPTPPAPPDHRLPTSHDIVQIVRRLSRQRRIGHTGTLDPMASGVLVLCLGQATRLVEYYQGHRKQYQAWVQLGTATDTYDALGETVATAAVAPLNSSQIENALQQFRGDVLQSPPVYSALKQGGESLHRKARRGEQVVVEPRPVTFYQIDLLDFLPPDRIHLRVVCSAGGYIRSLAQDLGLALGTVAHLNGLRREAAGPFTLQQALTLPAIEEAARSGQLAQRLLAPGYGLEMTQIAVDASAAERLGHGQRVTLPSEGLPDQLAQARDGSGAFIGIIRGLGGTLWKAEKWFGADE